MNKNILLLGYGYTAKDLSNLIISRGYTITATYRLAANEKKSHNTAIERIPFCRDAIFSALKKSCGVLISTPPNLAGVDPSFLLAKDSLRHQAENLQWIGYLSATNVYGDHKGNWVSENSVCNNPDERGVRRLTAERSWLSLFRDFKLPIHIFRLAGIYGPNRNTLVRILNGKCHSITKRNHVFSRIHVEDISRALYTSIKHPTPGEIFNLADDFPCAAEVVDKYATQLLGRPPLKQISYENNSVSAAIRMFYQQCRRVSNQKFKEKHNFQLKYSTYRQGLDAIHQSIEKKKSL